jgi:predicted transcriptional regulator
MDSRLIMAPREHTAFLSASAPRTRLLQYLRQHSGSPRELADALSTSRRGIQRNLTKFAEKGWAAKTNGEYHLTAAGALIAQRYAAFLDSLNVIADAGPLFQPLPRCLSLPDPQWLRNAIVSVRGDNHSCRPAAQYARWLRELSTECFRGILPVVDYFHHRTLKHLFTEKNVNIEIVTEPAVIEVLTASDTAMIESMFGSKSFTLYEHEKLVEVGFSFSDNYGFMRAYDNQGHLRACIKCSHPDFLMWIERLYERFRKRAQPVTQSI